MKKILSVLLSLAMLLTVLPLGVAADTNTLTVAEAIELGASQEHNIYTADKYYVTGVITEVYNSVYGNMRITDDDGNVLTLYGTWSADGSTRYDALKIKPVAGDIITVYGIVGQYNGTPQIKNGWITAHTIVDDGVEEPEAPAVSLVVAPDAGVEYKFGMIQENVSTTAIYYLDGGMSGYYMTTTTDVSAAIDVRLVPVSGGYYLYSPTIDQYINMELSADQAHINGVYSDTASTVYVYDEISGTIIEEYNTFECRFGTRNDKSYTTVGPVKVEYAGFYCQFYTLGGDEPEHPEFPEEPVVPEIPETPSRPAIVGEILDAAFALQPGESLPYDVTLQGIVISINEPYNATYGNITVGFRVEDRYIVCYRLKGNELDEIKIGDTIYVQGTLCNYNGTVEFNYPTLTGRSSSNYGTIPMKMVTNPQVGVAYKLGIVEEHISATDVYYLAGGKNGHYLMTGNSTYVAMDVYLEEAKGGYYLYLDYFGIKKYINMVEDPDNGYINATYESEPATVYTYNTERNTMTAIAPNGVLHALGSHSYDDYTTIGSIQMGAHYYAHFYQPDSDAPSYLIYEIEDGEVSIIGYTEDIPANLVIPDTIAGYPVIRIAYNAFYGCTTLQTVSIPEGVTVIAVAAFEGCTNLQSVSIPKSLMSIHGSAFQECSSLTDVYYAGSYAGRVEMNNIYEYNSSLWNANWHYAEDRQPDATSYLRYEIADGQVTIIDVSLDVLDDTIIPETIEGFPVTTIRCGAFERAHSLKTITIPASIKIIEDYAFIYCEELTDVYYGGTEKDRALITMTNDPHFNPWLLGATWHYAQSCTPGDINGDGAVGLVDIALLQRHLNGWDVTIVLDTCDVNGDGEINVRDYALLQQYLNGWDVTLG